MTFRSGHGTHLRLISSLERWGSCQGSLQRMGWPTHHRYYNAKFKLFPSDGVVVGTRWRFNTNDTWWSTYVNRLSKNCFVNITNHEAGNLNCWVGPEYTSSPLLSWTECMLQHRFSSAELNREGIFNSAELSWTECLSMSIPTHSTQDCQNPSFARHLVQSPIFGGWY